ncbi:MAG: ABC transporter permease [Clostridiales bacterium]|nr:ABC transporter permease [Clostridiales bacterium]
MGRLRGGLRLYAILNKRFIKKYVFTFLLCLTPFLVIGMRLISSQDAGVMTVLMYCGDDEGSQAVVDYFTDKDGSVRYEQVYDIEGAKEKVRTGNADCLWIFPDDLDAAVRAYVRGNGDAVVTVFERKDEGLVRLAREQVYGALYGRISHEVALKTLESDGRIQQGDALGERLAELYEMWQVDGNLISYAYLDGTKVTEESENVSGTSYLTSPMRGMLALLVLLCGLAAAMFYRRDAEDGIFSWTNVNCGSAFRFFYILTATADAGLAAYIGMIFTGTFTGGWGELFRMVLYVLSVAGFSSILAVIVRPIRGLGAIIPLLLIISAALSPVFIDIGSLPLVQSLLPTYHYLKGTYSIVATAHMAIYAAAVILIALILPENVASGKKKERISRLNLTFRHCK